MFKQFSFLSTLILIACSINLFAQTSSIQGTIKSSSGDILIGANVQVVGTKLGARSNKEGQYKITNVPVGRRTVRVTYIGYSTEEKTIEVNANETVTLNFSIGEVTIESKAISVVASRATYRETPVAFSNVDKQNITEQLGSRDIPMVLKMVPGVYATDQGGGAGDSRMNIRGFDQRNVSIMINGVPVNDMENGWVYWSNWDGLGDVTSSVQIQRGLGAGKMANPSVGGTMNIITDPAYQRAGVKFKQEFASGSFLKSTVVANTGKIGGFSASIAGVRKVADGVVDKTWTDAWAYYIGMSYDINKDHQIEFYLIGAPQEHGQRTYQKNAAYWDKEFAKDNGMRQSLIDSTTELGIDFNSNWGPLKGDINTSDYYNDDVHDRRDNSYLMERENYYHKPQVNLNWYWNISEKVNLTNVFYLSNGIGGGSGPGGASIKSDANGYIDFQGVYNYNTSSAAIDTNYSSTLHRSKSILRNSVNQHIWYGYLGTVNWKPINNLTVQTGLDLRYYKGEHWQEVRNLLGGDYFYDRTDATIDYMAHPEAAMKKLGDIFSYHNDGLVNWVGGFAQGEYKFQQVTTYLNLSLSNTGYKRKDYFRTPDMPNGRETDFANFLGYTVKAGANYNITDHFNIFGNLGHYNRAPLFRNVFNFDNSKYNNIKNEKVFAYEVGAGYNTSGFQADLNLYLTQWKDRSWFTSSFIQNTDGSKTYFNYNLPGLNANHMGVEFNISYRPIKFVKVDGMLSLGNWKWGNDVIATYSPEDVDTAFTTKVYSDGLKVSDAAQTTAGISVSFYPLEKTSINFTYNYFADYYASFDPAARNNPNDRQQPWKVPSYGLLDGHINFGLPLQLPVGINLSAHFFNILDSKYVADAQDGKDHTINTSQVFIGLPFRWNVGVEITY